MIKKLCFVLIIAATLLPSAVSAKSFDDFSDLNDSYDWARPHINKLISLGWVEGYSDGIFKPNENISIAEFLKIMLVMGGQNVNVPDDENRDNAIIEKAKEAGLISREPYPPPYDPNEGGKINRGYLPKIITNNLTKHLGEELQTIDARFYIRGFFYAENYYNDNISNCVAMGIIQGRDNQEFEAGKLLTRAEACVIAARMFDNSLRVTPKKLTGIVETSFDWYEVEPEFAK